MSGWPGRRVLVTGAGGFLGSHLCGRLVAEGARVGAFLRYRSRGGRSALEWLDADVAGELEVVAGDLRDPESVGRAVAGADVVFHLGAQVAIPYSYLNPRDFAETNVLGTLNVLAGCLAGGVGQLVHTSTSEVYGTAVTTPMDESHPRDPRSPYAATKLGADALAVAHHRSFGLPVTIVRPFNAYGPHQSARAVLPAIVTQALAGGEVRLGALDPRRDLTFVADVVEGFLAAAERGPRDGSPLHLATGRAVSVGDLAALVGEVLGRELTVVQDPARLRPADGEVGLLVGDAGRMRERTGWAPAVELREGLVRTVEWIDGHSGAYRPGEYAT